MHRPKASSSSAGTTTMKPAHATHVRQASVKSSSLSHSASSTLASFVTNLRLLDLDLLPDWPHITAHSLGSADARSRIRGAEHALYQLFRLWDPVAAADKLRPFYPPLEPMQSVNLRAALFRALAELKKSSVLPRDAPLRKSMLDDCHDERFWDVCLAFSAAVVRRHALAKQRATGDACSVARRIGTASMMSKSDQESMLPLAIAHKAALRRVLDDKNRRRETYTRLYDVLAAKDTELRRRKADAQSRVAAPIGSGHLMAVEKVVEKSWVGSIELRDALIGGDVCAEGDEVLLRSCGDFLTSATGLDGDAMSTRSAAGIGFLQGLRDSVAEQSERRLHLQNLHERLVSSRPKPTPSSSRRSDPLNGSIRFDRHQNLTVQHASPTPGGRSPRKHERHDSMMRYDEILTAMREELRKNVSSRQDHSSTRFSPPGQTLRRSQSHSNPSRRTSILFDNSSGVHRHHQRSPSQTAVPMRPRLGSRASSRSRSYQPPKVAGQREPIPLKSEIYSPLKRSSAGSASVLASPAEDDETYTMSPSDLSTSGIADPERTMPAAPSCEMANGFTGVGLGIDANQSHSAVDTEAHASISLPFDDRDTTRAPQADATPATTDTPATLRPSLAERTRMSMAFNTGPSSPRRKPLSSDPSASSPSSENRPPTPPLAIDPSRRPRMSSRSDSDSDASVSTTSPPMTTTTQPLTLDQRTTHYLAQRARHSAALTPQPHLPLNPPIGEKSLPSTTRRPFATPVRARPAAPARPTPVPEDRHEDASSPLRDAPEQSQSGAGAYASGRRDITPLEQLMSPEADYESVFKRRPRLPATAAAMPRAAGLDGLDGSERL